MLQAKVRRVLERDLQFGPRLVVLNRFFGLILRLALGHLNFRCPRARTVTTEGFSFRLSHVQKFIRPSVPQPNPSGDVSTFHLFGFLSPPRRSGLGCSVLDPPLGLDIFPAPLRFSKRLFVWAIIGFSWNSPPQIGLH